MNPDQIKRIASAVVPLSLFLLAYVLLSPPTWVAALKQSLDREPGLAVIDDQLSYDPSDLRGMIWLPESALKKSLLRKVKRVLWLRPSTAEDAELLGHAASSCRQAHGIQICLVEFSSKKIWRLSEHLKGLSATTSKGSCVSQGGTKKCSYGEHNWEYLRREDHRFAGKQRDCIWSHPVADEELLIRTPKLQAGSYVLAAGVDDSGQREGLPAVQVKVTHPDAAKNRSLNVGDVPGFKNYALPALSQDGVFEFRLSVTQTGARFFCWDLMRKR
jgi:hypothetical protein